jgi:hypothetical protein
MPLLPISKTNSAEVRHLLERPPSGHFTNHACSLLGASVPARQSYYSIRSGVVAFACSRRDGPTVLSGGTYAASLESITRSCGLYIAGAQELNIPIIVGYQ